MISTIKSTYARLGATLTTATAGTAVAHSALASSPALANEPTTIPMVWQMPDLLVANGWRTVAGVTAAAVVLNAYGLLRGGTPKSTSDRLLGLASGAFVTGGWALTQFQAWQQGNTIFGVEPVFAGLGALVAGILNPGVKYSHNPRLTAWLLLLSTWGALKFLEEDIGDIYAGNSQIRGQSTDGSITVILEKVR